MFWTYIVLLGLCTAGASVFGLLAKNEWDAGNKKPDSGSKSNSQPVYNISGDYVNGGKQLQDNSQHISNNKTTHLKEKENKETNSTEKIEDKSKEPTVNNGIINSGVNNGNQTVNNYNYGNNIARQLNNEDIDAIRQLFL